LSLLPEKLTKPYADRVQRRAHSGIASASSDALATPVLLSFGCLLLTSIRTPEPWSTVVFWFSYLVMVSVAVYTSFNSTNRFAGVLPILILSFVMHLIVPVRQPAGFTWDWTSAHEMQLAQAALQSGTFLMGSGSIFALQFSYFPGVQMIIIGEATIAGLPLEVIMRFLGALVNPFILLSIYALTKNAFKSSPSSSKLIIASLVVYASCPLFNFKDAFTVYESFAVVMLPLILATWRRSPKMTVLSTLMLVTVVISHSLTSYMLFAFILTIALTQRVLPKQVPLVQEASGLAILSAILLAAWGTYVAVLVSGQALILLQVLAKVFLSNPSGPTAPARVAGQGDLYLTMLGLAPLGGFALVGFLRALKERRASLASMALAGGFIMVAFYVLIPWRSALLVSQGDLQTRGIEFGYLGIAPIAAMGIAKLDKSFPILEFARRMSSKFVVTSLIVLIFLPTIFVGFPHLYYRNEAPQIAPETLPEEKFQSAVWLSTHSESLESLAYTSSLSAYYSGYFKMDSLFEPLPAIVSRDLQSSKVVSLDLLSFSVKDSLGRSLGSGDIEWMDTHSDRVYSSFGVAIFITLSD
jgi:hypothetical protein